MPTIEKVAPVASKTTSKTGRDRDYCWYSGADGRCTKRTWGGTLVCRDHMKQGVRRFIADSGLAGDALERRVEAAMSSLDGSETVRKAQIDDPGRLRF